MAGIFGGHLFSGQGLGQAADMTFTQEEVDARTSAASAVRAAVTGGGAYMPPAGSKTVSGGKTGASPAPYMPGGASPAPFDATAFPAVPATDNTMLYVGTAVVAAGVLAVVFLRGGNRRTVTANRRRGRRSRAR